MISQLVCHGMDEHQDISEQSSVRSLSASERSLQAKIVRLENQLQGYKSQIGKARLILAVIRHYGEAFEGFRRK